MPIARVTSKGQVTIPVEVRRALGLETGASLVFEVAGEYATVRRAPSLTDVASRMRRENAGTEPMHRDRDRAIEAYFTSIRSEEEDGDELLVAEDGAVRPWRHDGGSPRG